MNIEMQQLIKNLSEINSTLDGINTNLNNTVTELIKIQEAILDIGGISNEG